jgi:mercuric ion transport protein
MATKEDNRMSDLSRAAIRSTVEPQNSAGLQRGQKLMAAGGLLGALAASSCCILPLVLFSLGVSGAWIGNFTQLAPYQPYFIAATIACLGYGYWLVYRASKVACADGEACARPMPNRLVRLGLILATVLVVAAIGFNLVAPLFLDA